MEDITVKLFPCVLSFSALILFLFSTVASANDDFAAMSALRAALTPTPPTWIASDSYCDWNYIACDSSLRVTIINLASLSLSGTLPPDLGSLSHLRILFLQKNSLGGAFPSLSNLSSLQELHLDSNNFTYIPARSFRGLSNLRVLSLADNINLDPWSIPAELAESTNLVSLYADNANIVGTLPDFLGELPMLENVSVSYNSMTGGLPSSFAGSSIRNLWLNNQAGDGFSGTLDVLSTMDLYQVWLQKNAFSGPIPDLSRCENLFDLQLRDNRLTGLIPTSLFSIPTLQNVSLDNNKLQGSIPSNPNNITVITYDGNNLCNANTIIDPCNSQVVTLLEVAGALGFPTILADSWVGDDPCSNWSFITCDQGSDVTIVNFAKQNFEGSISPAIGNLTSLHKLFLNDNNLTGPIPSSLATLPSLQTLDVSNNNLSPPLPTFPATLTNFSVSGNPLLNKNTTAKDNTQSTWATNSLRRTILIVVGVVLGFIIFLIIVLGFTRNAIHARKSTTVDALEYGSDNNGGYLGGAIPMQVLRQATDNFNAANIIGRGGFGVVYKGELLNTGRKIAVKRMELVAANTNRDGIMNEFEAEISVLTKVRHRHLVALLGYCISGGERLLVYEYMPKGTLAEHLFKWQERGTAPLTWKQRVTVALDVARGVEYLHGLAQQSFIHRDLKPSNILINDDMRAKVADFGLVRNVPDGKYSVDTRVAGTFGYLAPEYAKTGRMTTKVDVYAFGVVLMELITGRKALNDSMPDEPSHLETWFRQVLTTKLDVPKAVDPTLNPIIIDEETADGIYKVAQLAGLCTAEEPSQRPNMSHAVNVLVPLVERWKPCSHL